MLHRLKRRLGAHQRWGIAHGQRQSLALIFIVLGWSLAMGWLLAMATSVHSATPATEIGTTDVVPPQYQLNQELYLKNCSSCHLALPPGIFPSQTWKNLLEDSQHYGATLQTLARTERALIWKYLSTFSRSQQKDEVTPYRIKSSRYFKALHPQVDLPRPVQISSCISCHPSANDYNFRRLSPESEK